MVTKDQVVEKLKEVKDPELGIDIYTLGLVYEITPDEEGVHVLMTLTTPFCPFADQMLADVESRIGELFEDDALSVRVDLTFDPAWEPTPELRKMLGV